MKLNLTAVVIVMAVSAPAFAQDAACGSIKADKQRLACYDKANSMKKLDTVEPETGASAPVAKREGIVFKSGAWQVIKKIDPMTDKATCTSLYRGEWKIQGAADSMYVSYQGRGGIKAYTLRVDEDPADKMRLASDTEKKLRFADLQHSFARIYNSTRVRLQTITVLDSILTDDIDMQGFKAATDYVQQNCSA